MAKRQAPSERLLLEAKVAEVLKRHFESVSREVKIGAYSMDFVASRDRARRRLAVECRLTVDGRTVDRLIDAFIQGTRGHLIQDFFIVANEITGNPDRALELDAPRGMRLFTFDEFEAFCQSHFPPLERKKRESKIQKAVAANKHELLTTCAVLDEHLQQSIASLKKERPNSPEATADRDERVADLEELRRRLVVLKRAVAKPGAKKEELEKPVLTFREGVERVWEKHYEWICTRSAEASLFVLAITACGLAGAGGPVAVVVSGAIAANKTIAEALKSVRGKLKWPKITIG